MAVIVVSFSFSMAAQPSTENPLSGVLAFPSTARLLPSSTVLLALLLAYLQLSSIRRPYITFKLPRSNIDTPQRLRNLFRFPATGCVTSFRCTTLNGIFGRVKRSKHNKEKKLWVNIVVCLASLRPSVSHNTKASTSNERIKRRIYSYKEVLSFTTSTAIQRLQ